MNDKMLGVLGGMGPLASAHFMVRLTQLTPAARDQDHVPAVLWSDPRVPDRTVADPSGAADPLPWLLRGIDGLERAGCGAIAIPCNTAHRWYDAMRAHARVPVLHIVDAAAVELRGMRTGSARIGVMATQAALGMRLYQDRLGAPMGLPRAKPGRDGSAGEPVNRIGEAQPHGGGLCAGGPGGAKPGRTRRDIRCPGLHGDPACDTGRPHARSADRGYDRRPGACGDRLGTCAVRQPT